MPILSPLERKSPGVRALVALTYLVLTLGALTMVYPFLVMIGSSLTSTLDVQEYRIVPRYFRSDAVLYQKHVEEKYGGRIELLNGVYGSDYLKFSEVPAPAQAPSGAAALAADWRAFTETLPLAYRQPLYRSGIGTGGVGQVERRYQEFLVRKYGDVAGVNRAYQDTFTRLSLVLPPFEEPVEPSWKDPDTPCYRDWREFKATLPPDLWLPVPCDAAWRTYLHRRYEDLAALNRAWHTQYSAWAEVVLPASEQEVPRGGACLRNWREFVARHWPRRYVVRTAGAGGKERPERLAGSENLFRDFAAQKYATIAAANAAWGTSYPSFAAVPAPHSLNDWQETLETAGALKQHFALRNYRTVIERFALEGRSLWNTLFFCVASILIALTVNPLCAYALSRFQLPYAFKVLLFLLATIAFPAEVSMIPGFLLLKNLGMLNTFWALILPGAANGYAIFLLKGFFDSLPLDLYEAGMLDGASEWTLFTRVTIPLSMPILAVTALGAFTGAYGAFLFALVVCQDPRMWTLMVHVYQIQVDEPRFVLMAALVLTSLPTLLVFMFTQRIILRGIILPSYK